MQILSIQLPCRINVCEDRRGPFTGTFRGPTFPVKSGPVFTPPGFSLPTDTPGLRSSHAADDYLVSQLVQKLKQPSVISLSTSFNVGAL